jgi:hypothetical protein
MTHELRNLSISRVALVPSGSNPEADIVLFKSTPKVPPIQKEIGFMKKHIDVSKLTPSELEVLGTILAKSATDIADPAPPAPPPSDEAILKTLPPDVMAIVQKAKDDAATARADAESATAVATFEKVQRETSEFVTVTTPLIKAFPGDAGANARILYRVKKSVSADDYTELEKMIKSGSAALAQVTGAIGGDGATASVADATGQLKKIAKEKQAANPKLTFTQAYEETLTERPDLVKEARG